jgi:dephospho-CoA kinase
LAADKIFNKIDAYKQKGKEFKFKITDAFKENRYKIVESKKQYEEELKKRKQYMRTH